MKDTFDYKTLYLEKYKKLPIYYFWSVLLSLGSISTIVSIIFFVQGYDYGSYTTTAICVLLGGWILAISLAYFIRWISSVTLSQSVVVADSLLEISKKTFEITTENSVDTEEELPEI
jgi:hypothetical protein